MMNIAICKKLWIIVIVFTLIGCLDTNDKVLVGGSILYSYEVAAGEVEIWEYDVSTDKAAKLIRHHAKDDSAVFNSAKSKIIFDSFDPNSETKSHHLFVSDFPILSSITDLSLIHI